MIYRVSQKRMIYRVSQKRMIYRVSQKINALHDIVVLNVVQFWTFLTFLKTCGTWTFFRFFFFYFNCSYFFNVYVLYILLISILNLWNHLLNSLLSWFYKNIIITQKNNVLLFLFFQNYQRIKEIIWNKNKIV